MCLDKRSKGHSAVHHLGPASPARWQGAQLGTEPSVHEGFEQDDRAAEGYGNEG